MTKEEQIIAEEELFEPDVEKMMDRLDEIQVTTVSGRITETIGLLIKAIVPHVKIGEVCLVKRDMMEPLMCEVVGFTSEEVLLSPLGEMKGIGPSSEVIPTIDKLLSAMRFGFGGHVEIPQ